MKKINTNIKFSKNNYKVYRTHEGFQVRKYLTEITYVMLSFHRNILDAVNYIDNQIKQDELDKTFTKE